MIVSDLRVYRDGLAAALQDDPAIALIGAAAHPNEALHRAGETEAQVILLDARMPDSLDAVRLLREQPSVRLIALGADDSAIPDCVDAGVVDYLPPEATVAEIRAAVQRSAGGATSRLALATRTDRALDGSPSPSLTRREQDVFGLLQHGLTNKEIARRLYISPLTVKNHVHSILQKLGASRRSQIGGSWSLPETPDRVASEESMG